MTWYLIAIYTVLLVLYVASLLVESIRLSVRSSWFTGLRRWFRAWRTRRAEWAVDWTSEVGIWCGQFVCGLKGHSEVLHFEGPRISMLCTNCGHQTKGLDTRRGVAL